MNKNELVVRVKTKQAWVMLKTYLERVFGKMNYSTSGYRTEGNSPFSVIFVFESQKDRDEMQEFFDLIVHGFETVPDRI